MPTVQTDFPPAWSGIESGGFVFFRDGFPAGLSFYHPRSHIFMSRRSRRLFFMSRRSRRL
jgi:hypothetical protein